MFNFIVCDLETTGLDPGQDRIIEIGMVKVDRGKPGETFSTTVNPEMPLPVKVKRLTGLEDHMFENSPRLGEISAEVIQFTGDLPFVGHNVDFDAGFLEHHLDVSFPHKLDTLELAKIVSPDAPGHRLPDLCKYFGIECSREHRALSDALATARLALTLLDELKKTGLAYLARLDNFLKQANSSWALYTGKLLAEKTRFATGKDLQLRYPRHPADPKHKPEDRTGEKRRVDVDTARVKEIFSDRGPLKKHLDQFETRPQQIQMAVKVTETLNHEKCLLMEAGTGTGKSLAYLIPSLMWALANKKRALVATQTINLQEQLWNKDIPILKKISRTNFSAALVKGRGNYLCLRRWESVLESPAQLNEKEALFFARILMWLGITKTGDKHELNMSREETDYWHRVCSDPEICQSSFCRWFHRHCFVGGARRAAANADIIVTNHSLLFADLRPEHKILPSFGPLIIDEAHHLEDVATIHLGKQVSRGILRQWLQSVSKTLGKLSNIIPPRDSEEWQESLLTARKERNLSKSGLDYFIRTMGGLTENRADDKRVQGSVRLRPGDEIQKHVWAEISNLTTAIKSTTGALAKLARVLGEWGNTDELWLEHAWTVKELVVSGNTLAGDLEFIGAAREENQVYWIEGKGESYFNLVAAPVNVGELLYQNLLKDKTGIVLTSATMTAGESFKYFAERTGVTLLPEENVIQKMVPSPFNYEKQCLLCIDKSTKVPGETDENTYFNRLARALELYITAAGGRSLILFTSHHALKQIYYRLKDPMEEQDICILGHNIDGGRNRLVEQFKNTPRAALLGASSFWEGVDIPGPALCNVIIIKLPFWPPGLPVIEARLEELQQSGANSFSNFTLPQAVIRFKQGFGRLIRTSRDKGTVIIMDKRLISKRYGRAFLSSLPLKTHIQGDPDLIKGKISKWINGSEENPPLITLNSAGEVKRHLEMCSKRHI